MHRNLWSVEVEPGSDALIVAFSGKGVPPGRFEPHDILLGLGASVLFVNCEQDSWYLDIWDDVLAQIKAVRADLCTRQVLYYGFSMGAFASLRAHLADPAAASLSLSPETTLGLPSMHSAHAPRFSIEAKLRRTPLRRAVILFGRNGLSDGEFFHRTQGIRHLDRYVLPCGHNTQPWLNGSGMFGDVVKQVLFGSEALRLPAGSSRAFPEAPFVYPLFLSIAREAPHTPPDLDLHSMFWLECLSRRAAIDGDYDEAVDLFEQAKEALMAQPGVDFDPVWRDGHLHHIWPQYQEWLSDQLEAAR